MPTTKFLHQLFQIHFHFLKPLVNCQQKNIVFSSSSSSTISLFFPILSRCFEVFETSFQWFYFLEFSFSLSPFIVNKNSEKISPFVLLPIHTSDCSYSSVEYYITVQNLNRSITWRSSLFASKLPLTTCDLIFTISLCVRNCSTLCFSLSYLLFTVLLSQLTVYFILASADWFYVVVRELDKENFSMCIILRECVARLQFNVHFLYFKML